MTLDPDRYECPDHHTNLTSQVQEALDDQDFPVAYQRPLLGRKPPAARPFQVIITCPGDDATAPHSLTCTGAQAR
jgi:hypothetical protein